MRSSRPGLARWQDWLERPWGWVAGGCHPNRATDQLLASAGFWIDSLERDKLPKAPPLVRPVIQRSGDRRAPRPAVGAASLRTAVPSCQGSSDSDVIQGDRPSASTCLSIAAIFSFEDSVADETMNHFRSSASPRSSGSEPPS